MTRKHFRKLANDLHIVKPDDSGLEWAGWLWAVRAVAASCQSFNPNFDRDKFITACMEGC